MLNSKKYSEHHDTIAKLQQMQEVQHNYIINLQDERRTRVKQIEELEENKAFLTQQLAQQQGIILEQYAMEWGHSRYPAGKTVCD